MTATDRAAKARATRTASKHDRWIGELRGAGYSVVRASHVTVEAFDLDGGAGFGLRCYRCCNARLFVEWDESRPLPAVLHAVNSHACEAAG